MIPANGILSYASVRVEVRERLDSSLAVYYYGQSMVGNPALSEAPVLSVRNIAGVISQYT